MYFSFTIIIHSSYHISPREIQQKKTAVFSDIEYKKSHLASVAR